MGHSGETNPSRGLWKLIFSAVALLLHSAPRCANSPGAKSAQVRRSQRDKNERHRGGSETASKGQ